LCRGIFYILQRFQTRYRWLLLREINNMEYWMTIMKWNSELNSLLYE
jgi:hypothetical protein